MAKIDLDRTRLLGFDSKSNLDAKAGLKPAKPAGKR